jgi:hypothetical protein
MTVVRRTPGCTVEFLGEAWRGVAQESLIAVTTDKSLGKPAGEFQIRINVSNKVSTRSLLSPDTTRPQDGSVGPSDARQDLAGGSNFWLSTLKPMMLVRIRMRPVLYEPTRIIRLSKSPRPSSLTMLGCIDNVSLQKSMTPQGPKREIVVTGRDLGKLFADDAHYTFPFPALVSDVKRDAPANMLLLGSATDDQKTELLKRYFTSGSDSFQQDLIITTVGQAIDALYKKASALDVALPLDDVRTAGKVPNLRDYLPAPWVASDVRDIPFYGGVGFMQMSGSVWSLFEYVVPKPWGEIFIDTVGEGARLIVRRPPWGRPWADQDRVMSMVVDRSKVRTSDAGVRLGKAAFTSNDTEQLNEAFDVSNAATANVAALEDMGGKLWHQEEFETPTGQTRVEGKPYHKVTDTEVLSLSLGRNDREALNLYFPFPASSWLQGDSDPVQAAALIPPIMDVDSVLRYGLRLFQAENRWWFPKEQPVTNGTAKVDILGQLLLDSVRSYFYFRDNPSYLSGTIVMMGRDEIRIGDHLTLSEVDENDPMLFYVEGVSNTWEFGSEYVTTLRVTRGQPLKLTMSTVGQLSPGK